MSWLIGVLLVLGGWAQYAPPPAAQGVDAPPLRVVATFYTCENVRGNPMAPCGLTRDESDPTQPGIACPASWLGRVFDVPDYGIRRCDDTGRHDTLYGLPHIDIRVPTLQEAINGGVQEMEIREVQP